MEGCLNRKWNPILPGCGGTAGFQRGRDPILPGLCSHYAPPANRRSARGIGVSTPCGAVSTRENSMFVPGVLEL